MKLDYSKLVIYDIETLKNLFVINVIDVNTLNKKSFVFFNDKKYEDQPFELYKFLKSIVQHNYTMIGFNNLGFDAQVMHYFYDWCAAKQDPLYHFDIDYIINELYLKAQGLINYKNTWEDTVPEYKLFASQIDLYKQHHYDRPQKATSLKWLEFSMRRRVIREMPYKHDDILTIDQVQDVVDYCWEDIDATLDFFTRVRFETEVRHNLSESYNLNLINASEPRMVREIFGKFLCKELNMSYAELKKLKTVRKSVHFKDVIFPYIKYQTPEFKEMLNVFNTHHVVTLPTYKWGGNQLGVKYNVKEHNDIALKELQEKAGTPTLTRDMSKFSYTFKFKDLDVYLGLGGIHACTKPGVYTHNEDEVIEDADGTSFYPFLAIKNECRPEHLGKAYNVVYPMMYEERIKYDKKDPRNYIFKIILNSAYGLSKEINGYLYDPKYTYTITINGQLSLLMLAEALSMSVPDIQFIQMNTDGLTYKYNKKYTDKVRKICEWWEKTTKINLEYAYYEKMVIMDVNNYMAIKEGFIKNLQSGEVEYSKLCKDYVKKKGLFEIDMPYHKNPSNLIVPKALEQYFTIGTDYNTYIENPNNSIFDYCAGVKGKSNFKLNLHQQYNFTNLVTEQQKVCRFFVSKQNDSAGLLYKDFKDGRSIAVVAQTIVQPLDEVKKDTVGEYSVDIDWYKKETKKIIDIIEPKAVQAELF